MWIILKISIYFLYLLLVGSFCFLSEKGRLKRRVIFTLFYKQGAKAPALLEFSTPFKFEPKQSKFEIEFELNKAFTMIFHSVSL